MAVKSDFEGYNKTVFFNTAVRNMLIMGLEYKISMASVCSDYLYFFLASIKLYDNVTCTPIITV